MRVTYDPQADAAYVHLTRRSLSPGRDTTFCEPPVGENAMVNLDWKDGKVVGLEVLSAKGRLHSDLLALSGWTEATDAVVIGTPGAKAVELAPADAGGFTCRIMDYGMEARLTVRNIMADAAGGLVRFFQTLNVDWRGWEGERVWNSETLEEQLAVSATSPTTGPIELRFTLTERELGWSASTEVFVDRGEELKGLAEKLERSFTD